MSPKGDVRRNAEVERRTAVSQQYPRPPSYLCEALRAAEIAPMGLRSGSSRAQGNENPDFENGFGLDIAKYLGRTWGLTRLDFVVYWGQAMQSG